MSDQTIIGAQGDSNLRILSASAVRQAITACAELFHAQSGQGAVARFDTSGAILRRLGEGETCDVTASSLDSLQELAGRGLLGGAPALAQAQTDAPPPVPWAAEGLQEEPPLTLKLTLTDNDGTAHTVDATCQSTGTTTTLNFKYTFSTDDTNGLGAQISIDSLVLANGSSLTGSNGTSADLTLRGVSPTADVWLYDQPMASATGSQGSCVPSQISFVPLWCVYIHT